MSSSRETLLNNRYRLKSQLASGGMAVVYKAIDEALGRTVAIKILRPSLTAQPAFIARFQNEARSIANLGHPNIVTVHDVGSDGPTHFIVMELVDGSDLKRVVRTFGALPIDRAVNLALQIADGIGYAHRAGIVHADVKPQNVLLTQRDEVKITDFGIAQAASDTQPNERASVVWGSPHYFAPEQAQGEKPTAASDVYSIGIVMFEMLTGRLPFTGASQQDLAMAHIQTPVPSVKEYNPSVPDELADIVRKLMKKNPNDRFRQASQLSSILRAYVTQSGQGTVQGAAKPPVSPEERSAPTAPPSELPGVTQPSAKDEQSRGMRTQQYSAVPDAPQQLDYQQRGNPGAASQTPPPPGQAQHPRAFTMPPRTAQTRSDSQPLSQTRFPYNQQLPQEDDGPFAWDGVTIALGFLALMAVACLIPLYIVAIQAQFG